MPRLNNEDYCLDELSEPSNEMREARPPQLDQPLPTQLRTHAEAVGIMDLEPAVYVALAKYCLALWDWNTKINLTRHTTAATFVQRDLLDTYQLVQHLQPNETVLDFGSGSGVPGLTAAILRPDLTITLCDSVQKKSRVLENIAAQLKLPVEVFGLNVKDVLAAKKYDVLTARAVGSISKMCTWLAPFWGRFGRLITIKGPTWIDERGEARHLGQLRNIDLRKLAEYPMLDHNSASVILQLTQKSHLSKEP